MGKNVAQQKNAASASTAKNGVTPQIEESDAPVAAMVLRISPKSLRIYSIAVSKDYRGQGYGQLLLDHAFARARDLGKTTVTLEVDTADKKLLRWYSAAGFKEAEQLPDYYGQGLHGLRMRCSVAAAQTKHPVPAARTTNCTPNNSQHRLTAREP